MVCLPALQSCSAVQVFKVRLLVSMSVITFILIVKEFKLCISFTVDTLFAFPFNENLITDSRYKWTELIFTARAWFDS